MVVLNYHGRDDTMRCVRSLLTGTSAERILVVDNGSFDGVLEEIAQRWPTVSILQTGVNLGFSGGMNAGLSWALERDAETITVLNNDTVVPAGAVSTLARVAREGAAVSPVVHYMEGGDVWFGGGTVDSATALARHLTDEEIQQVFDSVPFRPVDTLAGCCITASAATWRRVGGFDERFFLIFEDSDWSLRARSLGIPLMVDASVHIHHRVSASFTGAYALLGTYYYTRNGLLFGTRWSSHRGDPKWRSLSRSLLFLRRHVMPPVVSPARHQSDVAETLTRGAVVCAAVVHHMRGRYGRAPRWLEHGVARRLAT